MATLKRAIEIAVSAHAGQLDQDKRPHLDHVLRVMQAVEGEQAKMVALLHDVIDACPGMTAEHFRQDGFPDQVIVALALLSNIPTHKPIYLDHIARICRHRLAARVKLADLLDQADLTRLGREPSEYDIKLNQKRIAAICALENALSSYETNNVKLPV